MQYDLIIIGAGPAGYSAAFEAVRQGMRTAVFEDRDVGGTCLNRGCVPTKYLAHVGNTMSAVRNAGTHGVVCAPPALDLAASRGEMDRIIAFQREAIEGELAAQGVELLSGTAAVSAADAVSCGGRTYRTRYILIAAGSRPAPLLLPNAVTSDEILKLEQVPERLHILGGGTVAVEFAHIFRALGSDVTLHIRADRILRKWDREIAVGVTQAFRRRGIKIEKNCDFGSLRIDDGVVLSAAGREPIVPAVADGLVEIRKGIVADRDGRTRTGSIYAAGDVLDDSAQLAHVAMAQGRRAVRHMAGKGGEPPSAVVQCIYLDQEIASVGHTEKTAAEAGIDAAVGKANMYTNARTMISLNERGFIKLLAERDTGVVIGAQCMCERAGDLVAELALAVDRRLTVGDLLHTTRPHPSYCEAITDALRALEAKS